MDLATALKLIELENSWIDYSRRLAEAERDEELDDCTPTERVQIYVDLRYRWDGSRR